MISHITFQIKQVLDLKTLNKNIATLLGDKMKDNADVDIIIPIYNVSKYLKKCLDSIIQQSFSNYNVLLIDDGSTDDSKVICKEFSKKDKRFKYFFKNNGGLSDARNYGLSHATSEYVVFIDGDDFVDKDYIKDLYTAVVSTNSQVAVCGHRQVSEDGKNISSIYLPKNKTIISGRSLIYLNMLDKKQSLGAAWNKIYKRSLFDTTKFEKGRYFEDTLILIPLFWNIDRVCLVNKILYNYVQRNNSIMHSNFSKKKWKDYIQLYIDQISFLSKHSAKMTDIIIKNYLNWIFHNYYKIDKYRDLQLFLQEQFRLYANRITLGDFKTRVKIFIGKISLDLTIPWFKLKNID